MPLAGSLLLSGEKRLDKGEKEDYNEKGCMRTDFEKSAEQTKTMNRIRKFLNRHIGVFSLLLLVLLILSTFFGWRYYIGTIRRTGLEDVLSARTFAHHYVMISDDTSSALWQEIYRSATLE